MEQKKTQTQKEYQRAPENLRHCHQTQAREAQGWGSTKPRATQASSPSHHRHGQAGGLGLWIGVYVFIVFFLGGGEGVRGGIMEFRSSRFLFLLRAGGGRGPGVISPQTLKLTVWKFRGIGEKKPILGTQLFITRNRKHFRKQSKSPGLWGAPKP